MIPMKSTAATRGWLIFLVVVTSIVGPENASAAQTARTEVLSVGVAEPLMAAQVAIQKNHWDAALESIKQAQAAARLTAKDEYNIDALLGYVLYRQNKYKQAAAVYERLLESPLVPAAQVSERTKAIAEMYFKMGEYPRAAKWAKAFLGRHPDAPQVAAMLGDAYFRMDNYKSAVATMTALVADAEHDRRIPKESWLRIIEDSYYRLEDLRGMESALVLLVGYFHEPEDWRELLDLCSRDVHDERIALGYHRLMFELNVLTRPDDYEAMVFETLTAGVPAEALQVLDSARNEDVFSGPDSMPGRYERLFKRVQKEVAANRVSLRRLATKPTDASGGQDDVLLGQIYLSYGQYDLAVAALNRGINKGGVQEADEAHMSLGIAYLQLGLRDLADEAFRAVDRGSPWAGLAELWRLRVNANALVNQSLASSRRRYF